MANGIADEQATISEGLQTTGLYGQKLDKEQADGVAGLATEYMGGIEDKLDFLRDPEKMKEALMGSPEIQQMMGALEKMFPELHEKIMGAINDLSGNMGQMLTGGGQEVAGHSGPGGQQNIDTPAPAQAPKGGDAPPEAPISVAQNNLPAGAGSQQAGRPTASTFETFGENRGDIAREANFPNGNVPREVYLSQAAGVGDQLQGEMGVGMSHDNTAMGAPEGDINLGIGHQAGMEQGIDFSRMS